MNLIRAAIVDDEKPARERLRRLLTRDPRVELDGVFGSGAAAIARLHEAFTNGTPLEVLFLDVQMPEIDGFGVIAGALSALPASSLPAVVFVTAHDEYALKAFDSHAIDYLLKPFSDERFQAALDRAIGHVRGGQARALMARVQSLLGDVAPGASAHAHGDASTTVRQPIDRLVVKGAHRVRLLPVDQISWIEADGMYVKLHTRDGAVHLHRGLLGSMDASLDPRRFVRIHRSAIVNLDLVDGLRQDPHGDYVVLLRDRTEIRVGRRFRARLQARLGQPL
jgi:two-component system LytT family response regulator